MLGANNLSTCGQRGGGESGRNEEDYVAFHIKGKYSNDILRGIENVDDRG